MVITYYVFKCELFYSLFLSVERKDTDVLIYIHHILIFIIIMHVVIYYIIKVLGTQTLQKFEELYSDMYNDNNIIIYIILILKLQFLIATLILTDIIQSLNA